MCNVTADNLTLGAKRCRRRVGAHRMRGGEESRKRNERRRPRARRRWRWGGRDDVGEAAAERRGRRQQQRELAGGATVTRTSSIRRRKCTFPASQISGIRILISENIPVFQLPTSNFQPLRQRGNGERGLVSGTNQLLSSLL